MGDELQNHGASHETPGDLVDDSVFGASNTAAPWLHMTPSVSGSVALATGTSTNGTPQSTSKTRHDSGLSLSELGMGEAHGVVRLTDTIEGWASTQSVKSAESWKRRYVRLQRKESLLLIYHHAEETRARHVINLSLCSPIESMVDHSGAITPSRVITVRTKQRIFSFSFGDEKDHATWVDHLQSAQKGYHAAKEGFLYKQGKIVKNWKNRWFVLKNRQLLYYKSKEEANETMVTGLIDLTEAISITVADDQIGRPHSIAVETKPRTYYLVAASADERNDWLTVLKFHAEYNPDLQNKPF